MNIILYNYKTKSYTNYNHKFYRINLRKLRSITIFQENKNKSKTMYLYWICIVQI